MSRPGRRLRSRIIATTALVSALAMAAMIGTVVLALNAIVHNNVDSTLRDRLSVISGSINHGGGFAQALEGSDDAIDDSTWLYDASGRQLDGPRAGSTVRTTADGLARVTSRTRVERHDRVYLAGPVTLGGPGTGHGVLVVSESVAPYEETRAEILVGLACLGLLVTAGATAIAAWTMHRALAPVDAMARLAEDWSEHELDARFRDVGSDHEIAHLGHTLNLLLDRVAGALQGEQRLTSELAHELRTPLTGFRGEVELVLMSGPDAATRERLERAVGLADQMGSTITTLLAIARGEAEHETRTTVDAVVAAALDGRASGARTAEAVDVPDGVRVDATIETAVRALSPLVDNALRYAAHRVTVSVRVTPRAADITVSDDGPGLAPEGDPDELFEAGTRGATSTGAGLGLSLARRVARTVGGDVTLTSPRQPTSFTLTLPRP